MTARPTDSTPYTWGGHELRAEVEEEVRISPHELRVGDIILSTARWHPLSAAIRSRSGSAFSHSALYLGDMLVAEAIGRGVVVRSITEMLADAWLTLAVVYRAVGLTGDQAKRVRYFAKLQADLGKKYDLRGVAQFIVGAPTGSDYRFYCSELVLASYRYAGHDLTAGTQYRPGDIATLPASVVQYAGHLRGSGTTSELESAFEVAGRGRGLAHAVLAADSKEHAMNDLTNELAEEAPLEEAFEVAVDGYEFEGPAARKRTKLPLAQRLPQFYTELLWSAIEVFSPEAAKFLRTVARACRDKGVSVAVGVSGGASGGFGLSIGGSVGTGLILTSTWAVGVYGSAGVAAEFGSALTGPEDGNVSGTFDLTAVQGGLESFNGRNVEVGATLTGVGTTRSLRAIIEGGKIVGVAGSMGVTIGTDSTASVNAFVAFTTSKVGTIYAGTQGEMEGNFAPDEEVSLPLALRNTLASLERKGVSKSRLKESMKRLGIDKLAKRASKKR